VTPLAAARRERGLTQHELANRARVSEDTIRRLERSDYTPVRSTAEKLAAALGLPVGALFDEAAVSVPTRARAPRPAAPLVAAAPVVSVPLPPVSFAEAYREYLATEGIDPLELFDAARECRHGEMTLPGQPIPTCGCWDDWGAT